MIPGLCVVTLLVGAIYAGAEAARIDAVLGRSDVGNLCAIVWLLGFIVWPVLLLAVALGW